ncbi:response regulator [Robbsia sp. Bb-Pol-6]|uniref:Response regulator n=1 Tax=Robbsia betulipollinis TaxID=2981849 RepID=A0ABT3ZH70_9BURK|nr:response regulator [Robbsia betulipollinis]
MLPPEQQVSLPPGQPVVLIVDDTPDNLALLSRALDSAGYAVLVARDGGSALERMARILPDVILLDAIMPGMDGFETCERIKANAAYRHVPVIFMTALMETEHVVNGFRVGGIDYVTKPIRPDEVVARVTAHVRRAASQRHADLVLELSSRAAVIATRHGEIQWHSAQAPAQLAHFFPDIGAAGRAGGAAPAPGEPAPLARLPDPLRDWLARHEGALRGEIRGEVREKLGERPAEEPVEFTRILPDGDRLVARIAGAASRGSWILIFEEHADRRDIAGLEARFGLTHREAEVLLWLSRGKTNRDIGQILKMMPRTVNKHLERVFVKLGVETRTAAAAAAFHVARWTR